MKKLVPDWTELFFAVNEVKRKEPLTNLLSLEQLSTIFETINVATMRLPPPMAPTISTKSHSPTHKGTAKTTLQIHQWQTHNKSPFTSTTLATMQIGTCTEPLL